MAPKILFVDDDPAALRLYGLALHRAGYETEVAQSGLETLDKLQSEKPDLVVLDIMMPGMDGYEVLRQMRAQPAWAQIPVIMVTALASTEDKIAGFEKGADDFLSKPVEIKELVARIRALLARARPPSQPEASRATILAFVGVKGGVGTTTLALNTALSAARREHSVILAELRTHGGTAAQRLGRTALKSIANLAGKEPAAITSGLVESCLLSHASGLRMLPAPLAPSLPSQVLSAEQAQIIIRCLSMLADHVILDLGSILDRATELALRQAHKVVLVTEPEAIALKAVSAWREVLAALEGRYNALHVVAVNRSPAAAGYTRQEIESILGSDLLALVVPAADVCHHACRNGVPILLQERETPIGQQLHMMAERLIA